MIVPIQIPEAQPHQVCKFTTCEPVLCEDGGRGGGGAGAEAFCERKQGGMAIYTPGQKPAEYSKDVLFLLASEPSLMDRVGKAHYHV